MSSNDWKSADPPASNHWKKSGAAALPLAGEGRTAIVPDMKRILFVAFAVLALLAGCSKKETPPPPEAPQVVKIPEAPRPPEPGVEFTDATKQQRYEAHFRDYLTKFESPKAGSAIWLTMRDGRHVGGRLESVGPDFIMINTTGVVSQVRASDLAMESRAQIFLADFARTHAIDLVNREVAASPAETAAKPAVRYALFDDIAGRIGPGREFLRAGNAPFAHGGAIQIIAEKDDWIQVRTSSTNSVWIQKYATYDLNELDPTARRNDLDTLQKLGIVSQVKPAENEVEVNLDAWALFDDRLHGGIARALAAYCATVRGNKVIFVTVYGRETQEKLGKYSQSFGWDEQAR